MRVSVRESHLLPHLSDPIQGYLRRPTATHPRPSQKVSSYDGRSLRFRARGWVNCSLFVKMSPSIFHSMQSIIICCVLNNAGYPPSIMLRWQRFLTAYAALSPLPFYQVAGAHPHLLGLQPLRHRLFPMLPPHSCEPRIHPPNQTSGSLGNEVLATQACQVEKRTTPASTRNKLANHAERTPVFQQKSPSLAR